MMTLSNAFSYTFPNMESMAMLNEKSNKIGKNHSNKGGWVLTVGDDVWGAVFRIQCKFPDMEGVAMLSEK